MTALTSLYFLCTVIILLLLIKFQFEFEIFFCAEGGHVNDEQSAYIFKAGVYLNRSELKGNY